MITSVMIKGFKSISSLSEPLELGLVNVFVGANGSGKTNLLEALGVLGAAASGQVDDQALLSRGVRPGTPKLYKTSFSGPRIPRAIQLSATADIDGHTLEYRVGLDNPIETPSAAWRYSTEYLDIGGVSILGRSGAGTRMMGRSIKPPRPHVGLARLAVGSQQGAEPAESMIDTLVDFGLYSLSTPVLRGAMPDPAPRDPVGLAGGRLAEALLDMLRDEPGMFGSLDLDDVLELLDWVRDIDSVPPSRSILSASVPSLNRVVRFTDRYMRERRNQLTGYDASEGALYILFLLTLAVHPAAPRLLAVDNFDQALNPRLARRMMRYLSEVIADSVDEKQLLITTHNPLVLDGLDISRDEFRLFAVDRASSGATIVRRINVSKKIMNAIGKGSALSTLWVTGRLGGVPDL
jgi:energy-coupling factor transporter ATP-binding protein EcfA2